MCGPPSVFAILAYRSGGGGFWLPVLPLLPEDPLLEAPVPLLWFADPDEAELLCFLCFFVVLVLLDDCAD